MDTTQSAPSREGVVHFFNRIAPTYDVINRMLSFRRDVAWRKRLVDAIPANRPISLLDLATGTADVLITALRRRPNLTRMVGIDMSENMLSQSKTKLSRLGLSDTIELRQGDATNLAVEDAVFDAVTIAFGIRNVIDTDAALREMWRILKPGGRALILEFSLPKNIILRHLYLFFFRHVLPRVAGLISGDAKAYEYLNKTVETYPYGAAFTQRLSNASFVDCSCKPLTFGVASLYTGQKIL